MGTIVQVDGEALPWAVYNDGGGGPPVIRYKSLTSGRPDVPPVQYVEYPPGQTDPVHSHDVGELFMVTQGEIWLDDARTGPGGVVYVAADTDYAVRAGAEGARYFRVVLPS